MVFLLFSGGMAMKHWLEMGLKSPFNHVLPEFERSQFIVFELLLLGPPALVGRVL